MSRPGETQKWEERERRRVAMEKLYQTPEFKAKMQKHLAEARAAKNNFYGT